MNINDIWILNVIYYKFVIWVNQRCLLAMLSNT